MFQMHQEPPEITWDRLKKPVDEMVESIIEDKAHHSAHAEIIKRRGQRIDNMENLLEAMEERDPELRKTVEPALLAYREVAQQMVTQMIAVHELHIATNDAALKVIDAIEAAYRQKEADAKRKKEEDPRTGNPALSPEPSAQEFKPPWEQS